MKKFLVFLFVVIITTISLFGNNKKIPYAEIKSMIDRSVELSVVKNPNLIYVNQPLFFEYPSGYQIGLIVKYKETMSSIAMHLLEKGDSNGKSLSSSFAKKSPVTISVEKSFDLGLWQIIIETGLATMLMIIIIFLQKKT